MNKEFNCKKCGIRVKLEFDEESKKGFEDADLKYCSKCKEEE